MPGERHWVRADRKQRNRMTKRAFVSYPGYVFAAWRAHALVWDRVLDLDLVSGVIMKHRQTSRGLEREPFLLPPWWRYWKAGDRMLKDLENLVETAEEGEAPPADFAAGDDVVITMDAFERHPAKCVFVNSEIARVVLEILGSQRMVDVPIGLAMKAQPAR